MQKNISIRRSAQKLAKAGQLVKALAAYEPLIASGDADPYDHLYVGDLHERIGNRDQAIAQYEAAIRAYNKLGFHRNGVALCRKILRLVPEHRVVYRLLGDLYTGEELYGDALTAYLCFFDRTPPERRADEEYRETLAAAITIAPRNADMALKLAALLEELDRLDEAAELLVRTAEVAREGGAEALAADLRARADAIDPGAALRVGVAGASPTEGSGPAAAPPQPLVAPVADTVIALDVDGEESPLAQMAAAPGAEPEGIQDTGLTMGAQTAGASPLARPDDPGQPAPGAGEDEAGPRPIDGEEAEAQPQGEPGPRRRPVDPSSFGEIELDGDDGDRPPARAAGMGSVAAALGEAGPADGELEAEQEPVLVIAEDAANDLEEVALELGTEGEADSAPAGRLADPAAATRQAMEAEQWTSALRRAEEWVQHDPCMEAVEKLIEISKVLQDNAKIVRGFLLKGDLLIRDGELQQAMRAFHEVLRRDPQNETALRRMARFRELGVVDAEAGQTDQPGPVQAVIEARNTVVAVREEPAGPRDERDWMEIGALLDEFREGVREQVGENDPQAHYDLGVSHQEMGLFEEALEEFAGALACRDLPPEMEVRLRELRGKCFARIDRHREAIQELRQALEIPEVGSQESAGIVYLLGLEHAQAGEVEQAKECMREVLRLKPDFGDAQAQLEAFEGDAA